MRKSDIISVLEIGTTKICCLIAEMNDSGEIEILGKGVYPSKGIKKGNIVDIEEATRCIDAAVVEAEKMASFDICSIFTGIKGEHIL